MGFVDDYQIPGSLTEVRLLRSGKLVGAENDLWLLERVEIAVPYGLIECLGFENGRRQEKLVAEFLAPLLPQIRWIDYEQFSATLSPSLREQDTRFDGLTKANLVGEDRALGQRRTEGKEGGFNLMRIQVNLRVRECGREFVHIVRARPFRQLMGKELGVIGRQTHWRSEFSVHRF
jgi:hypothetical protein